MLRGMILGFGLAALIAIGGLAARANWLASAEISITDPGVPVPVLHAIRTAEQSYYANRSVPRRVAEMGEDVLTFLLPRATIAADFSVGPYRVKPATINETLPWAVSQGLLSAPGIPDGKLLSLMAYASEQPVFSQWQAAVLVAHLRDRHPGLRQRSWSDIASDPMLTAKIYSGYMGAGGDWDGWSADLIPGPEAQRRMGLD